MTVIDLKTGSETTLAPEMTLSCAVGNFDGVHIGHRALLDKAAERNGQNLGAVWTFRVHPRICCGDGDARILTPTDRKLELFAETGLDIALLEDFPAVRGLSPFEFVSDILYKKCNVRCAVCGCNFRFGKDAAGNADDFVGYFAALGATAFVVPPVRTKTGEIVSSSLIRTLIENGEMAEVRSLLGHPFRLTATVSEGKKIGRRLGSPTINQLFPESSVIPKHGVYAVRCFFDGQDHIGVSNVGVRPTVTGSDGAIDCETHIIDYDGYLYGKTVNIDFYEFLRSETKFGSLAGLADAIRSDIAAAKEYFADK